MRKQSLITILVMVLVAASASIAAVVMMNGNNALSTTSGTNNDQAGGTTSIEKQASFEVTSLSISKHDVLVKEPVNVQVGVRNNGTADGTHQFNLTVDGINVNSSTVHLAAGEMTILNFTVSSSSAGNNTMSVGTSSTCTLTATTQSR